MIKQRNKGWNMLGAIQARQTIQLEEINRKLRVKKGRKIYRDRIKKIQTKLEIPEQRNEFYQQVGEECTKTYQPHGSKTILEQIMEPKRT